MEQREQRFELTLNGQTIRVHDEAVNRTLLDHLRSIGLTGSKQGCAEGDCGACTVLLVETDARGDRRLRAINACITLLPMVAGRELITVEGLADPDGALHPVQRALVEHHGSQCGYCTPGFTASMVEAFHRDDVERPAQVADQLCGNLCRCTGYRPIREAMADALRCRGERREDTLHQLLRKSHVPIPEVAYQGRGQTFLRPGSLGELLRLRAAHPEAELIAGATEIGVYINKKGSRYPFLISTEGVAELREITHADSHVRIGGAATLTALEEALAGEFPAIDRMLWVFASRQIRNRATLAGNLVTASPIGDMAPVLLALDARVELSSTRGSREIPLESFFTGYRRTALAEDEILSAVLLPRGAPAGLTRRTQSYKVSKRRELDISIVAAAFSIDTDADNVVRRARLAYGGVAPTPARARAAEEALTGKPFHREAVSAVLPLLAEAFSPISDARGSAGYRRALISSLFEKFCDGAESEAMDRPIEYALTPDKHARRAAHEADPSTLLHHESAVGHTTGAARYVDDVAQRRPMLEIWPVTSPHAHARILRRDASEARRMPGVVAVLMAEDIPGHNDVGAVRRDEILLADKEVMFHGHLVAVVVGESYESCRNAAAKVIVEYEPLPAILTLERAIAHDSFHNAPHVIRRGDPDAGLAASPHRIDGHLTSGGQEHFYLESHAAWAERGDEGDIFVSSSTQHPSEIQAVVSHVLAIPRNRVVVESPRMGGGFGGKETQGNTWAALAALAAWKTGRPVRVQLDRDLDIQLTGKRHPFRTEYSVGFDGEGRIRALKAQVYANGGWALDLSESICDRALFHVDNAYYLPEVELTGRVCKTHLVSFTAFRGFGGPQGMLVIEDILDRIARRLDISPEVVRERNMYHAPERGDLTPYGQRVEDDRLQRMWRALKESAGFDARRRAARDFNVKSPRVKRGIAITPVKFGISFTNTALNQAGALVQIYRDGTVQVNHGGTEMGQGLYTKIQGVAMRELGLPADRIRVMKTATDKVPNTSATAASSGADLNGAAVQAACESLRARLAPIAAKMLGAVPEAVEFADGECLAGITSVPFAKVVEAAYWAQVSLSATGYYKTPGIFYDRGKGQGKPFYYFAGGAAVTEVEIDGYTGMKRIRRVDILHDVGESLNPGIDRGQIEGAFVQGAGWLTGEELVWDAEGRLLTHSASTYQIPSFGDAPGEFHVTLLPHAAQRGTIHGSKAVGEPPFMLAISVREAIRDAIAAFGAPGGEVPLPAPATHEAIFAAIQARLSASSI